MKSMKEIGLASLLYKLFIIMTVISLFAVYMKFDNKFVLAYFFVYVAFTFFLLVITPIIGVLNSKYFTRKEIKNRCIKFIIIFLGFGMASHLLLTMFAPTKLNLLTETTNAFAIAVGISFTDIILFRKNEIKNDEGNSFKC